jgi:hypothetical protein
MAASTSDLFKKLAPKWTGKIGSAGVANGTVTSIPLDSTTSLPTDTAVVATINRVDANGDKTTGGVDETVIGVVSGNNLNPCTRGVEGTAQAHAAGQVVEILVTSKGLNDLIDGLLVEHNQSGTHKSATVTTLKATGAEIVTGTEDAKIVTPKAIADSTIAKIVNPWTAYVPTVTAPGGTPPTYTNTVTGKYCQIGKIVYMQFSLINTSGGTAGAGAVPLYFSLPITAADTSSTDWLNIVGNSLVYNGAATAFYFPAIASATTIKILDTGTSSLTAAGQDNAVRIIQATLAYEAA